MAGSNGGGKTRRTGASAKRAKATRGTKSVRKAVGGRGKAMNAKMTGRNKKRSAR